MARTPLPLGRRAISVALGAALLATVAPAAARPKKGLVAWRAVSVRSGRAPAGIEKKLRAILEKEGRRADWGRGRKEPVEASVEVRELDSIVDGDVVRVTCTAVGRIRGGATVKSKFSYGGKPHERARLEHHVLELVARGIVTRLSEIARADVAGWRVSRG